MKLPHTLRAFLRNKGAVIGALFLSVWLLGAIFAPLVMRHDPTEPVGASRERPGVEFPMGTDLLGRDVLTRVVYGARISLAIGFISVTIGLTLGTLLGLPAGYYGGWTESLIMRVIDTMLALPGLLLALVVIVSLGTGLQNVMIAVGVSSIPIYARLVRGSTLALRDIEYVQAARLIGNQHLRIMMRHILPNLIGPVIVLSTLQVGSAILVGSALSYLGMGAQGDTPEWGLMASDGRAYLARAWWMSMFPGFAIFSAVMAFNLVGDGLRAALDPRTRER